MGDNMQYSGQDYHCSKCGRDVRLMFSSHTHRGGKRMLIIDVHPKVDRLGIPSSKNCPTSGRFVKYQEVVSIRQHH